MDNILIISDFYDIQYKKDAGTPALRLIVEALAKKYVVHIILPDGEAKSEGNIVYHRVHVPQIPGGSIFQSKFNYFFFGDLAAVFAATLVRKYNPKLVYGAGCNSVRIAAMIGKRFHIPSVGRLFGTYLYPYLNHPISLLLRFEECFAFSSNPDRLIITNDGTRGNRVAEYFGVSMFSLCFWRNGVEVPKYENIFPSERTRIISMARLEKWKRIDRIINAFSEVAKKNGNVVLMIVGDGPERNNLESLSNSLGLKGLVKFYGELPRQEALQLLSLSDIFITTNDYSNVSNSLMEAMMAGKAVIALDTGATSDVVISDLTGLLVKDESEIPGAILKLCDDDIRRKMGERAKFYAEKRFVSWEERIGKEVALCEELIDGGKRNV